MTPISQRLDRLPDNIHGGLILMLAAALMSVTVLIVKLLGAELHVTQILFVRQIIMVAIVAPQVLRGFPGVLHTKRPGLQLMRIGFAIVGMLCGFTAVIHMPLADATAIAFAKSFFITIFAVAILSETVGARRWAAVAVGFAGVFVMLDPGSEGISYYGLLAIAGAASAGFVMVIIRLLSHSESTPTILSWQALGVGFFMAAPAIYFWSWPTLGEWVLLLGLGVISFLAQTANINAYRLGEASVLASLDYIRLLYAVLFGWLFFAQLPAGRTWLGAVIIVAASIYTIWREHRYNQALARSPEGRGYSS
jgi:drug/metabolite transporter (DMT)-like permease